MRAHEAAGVVSLVLLPVETEQCQAGSRHISQKPSPVRFWIVWIDTGGNAEGAQTPDIKISWFSLEASATCRFLES